MLARLKALFSDPAAGAGAASEEQQVSRAAAALLLEVARADFEADAQELESVRGALQARFELPGEDLDELIEDVAGEAREASSLHPYTQLIHQAWSHDQKCRLMEALWAVAYADGRIDRYEEHLLRRIADLLYLRHRDFIRSKHRAERAARP